MPKLRKNEFMRLMAFMKPKILTVYSIGVFGRAGVEASIYGILAFVFRDLMNAGVSGNMSLLHRAGLTVTITAVSASISFVIFIYMYQSCVKKTMNNLRMAAFEHIARLPVSYLENHHSGDIVSRITSDIQGIDQLYSNHIKAFVYTVLYGVSSAIIMLILEWRLAVILLAIIILTIRINSLFVNNLRRLSVKVQEAQSEANVGLTDLLEGFGTVRMFGLGKVTGEKYNKALQKVAKYALKRATQNGILESINFLIGSINFIGILAIGAYLFSKGLIDIGKVIAIVQLVVGVTFMFQQIGNVVAQIQASLAGAGRLFELMDAPPESENIEVNCTKNASDYMIELNNVFFQYQTGKTALNGVSYLQKMENVVALVGPSGGGKSTIMKILLGFYQTSSGEIYIKGKPISSYGKKELRDLVAYVPQDAFIFNGSIAENIRYGKENASDDELIKAARYANAHEFIMEFPNGYQTLVGEKGTCLSGGQKQRIAIARALVKDAPIIFLDEATASLDSESEKQVQYAIEKLMKNKTVLVIAHRLSTVENANDIYVLNHGKIVEHGKHESLLNLDGLYNKLYQVQFE